MLTDIFADRYLREFSDQNIPKWKQNPSIGASVMAEQLFPYWVGGKESDVAKTRWLRIHDQLIMELGVHELAPRYYS